MDLRNLTRHIFEQRRQNVILTLEKGQVVTRTHQNVYTDVMRACDQLKTWGITQGMRVGILS
ncbi:MAG TPA: hypothetical protein VFQ41_05815, partial [Candidatus Angelobacter sp.]|nr:hypothetical protein [Candidatus Angelobacter sp.]